LGAAEVRQAHDYGAKREKGDKAKKGKGGKKESDSITRCVSFLLASF
jgi:hypothetical protein